MASLFFYGTLRHLPLLEVVLGRSPDPGTLHQTVLPDATVTLVKDRDFPMIRLGTGGQADGILMTDLDAEDVARVDFYEGGFGYALQALETRAGSAQVYIPGPDVGPPGVAFDLEAWVEGSGALVVEAAREVMEHKGLRSATEVAKMSGAIRTRAASRLRARDHATGRTGSLEILDSSIPYATFFALKDYTLRTGTFAGAPSAPLERAVFLGMDAAVVLPYDPVRDRVLVIEQVRLGPIGRGDAGAWQTEAVAGHVDPGETPQEAALREAREEAGISLSRLEPAGEGYPSPGAFSEYLYLYVGLADLPDGSEGIAGLAGEGEDIRSHLISYGALMDMCDAGKITNGPLMTLALWLARHRTRLRDT